MTLLSISFLTSDRVLYARKGGEDVAATAANLGGDKITVDEAIVSVNNQDFLINHFMLY